MNGIQEEDVEPMDRCVLRLGIDQDVERNTVVMSARVSFLISLRCVPP